MKSILGKDLRMIIHGTMNEKKESLTLIVKRRKKKKKGTPPIY